MLVSSCCRTGKLVILDDSKSVAKFGDLLVTALKANGIDFTVLPLTRRGCSAEGYGVTEDRFLPDDRMVLAFVEGDFEAGMRLHP